MKNFDLTTVDFFIFFGKRLALFTFLLGTIILLCYYLFGFINLIFISLFFITTAIFLHVYVFIKLLLFWKQEPEKRIKINNTLLILSANIPIAMLYVKFGLDIYARFHSN